MTGKRAFVVLAGMGLAAFAHGATWHVAVNGSDAADGQSWGTAWATLGKGLQVAADDDTILVSNGIYGITSELVVNKGVILLGVGDGETVVTRGNTNLSHRLFRLTHPGAVLDGLTVSNGFPSGAAPANYGGGIYLNPSGTVRNCRVHNWKKMRVRRRRRAALHLPLASVIHGSSGILEFPSPRGRAELPRCRMPMP